MLEGCEAGIVPEGADSPPMYLFVMCVVELVLATVNSCRL